MLKIENKNWLDIEESAAFTNKNRHSVFTLIRHGKVEYQKIDKKFYILETDLEQHAPKVFSQLVRRKGINNLYFCPQCSTVFDIVQNCGKIKIDYFENIPSYKLPRVICKFCEEDNKKKELLNENQF